jgi:hypothetical protein
VSQRLRADALAPLHPKFVRRVVRGLAELQQSSLDRLARAGAGGADQALPDQRDLLTMAELAAPYLDTAFASGTDAAEALAGASLPSPDTVPPLSDDFAAELGRRVADLLRPALGAGGDVETITAGVTAAFEEFRDGVAEPLAATALIEAYEAGLSATLEAGGLERHAVVASSG